MLLEIEGIMGNFCRECVLGIERVQEDLLWNQERIERIE